MTKALFTQNKFSWQWVASLFAILVAIVESILLIVSDNQSVCIISFVFAFVFFVGMIISACFYKKVHWSLPVVLAILTVVWLISGLSLFISLMLPTSLEGRTEEYHFLVLFFQTVVKDGGVVTSLIYFPYLNLVGAIAMVSIFSSLFYKENKNLKASQEVEQEFN